jgi:hypothetical protein
LQKKKEFLTKPTKEEKLNKLGLSAPTHLWHTPFIIFLGGIPNSQNNKYAELTKPLQGLFSNNKNDGLLINQPCLRIPLGIGRLIKILTTVARAYMQR